MKTFSKEQSEAIELFDRDVCIFAGAGSGKTTLLVERFMHAVTRLHISPESILAVTFTDKAAAEMKKRLVDECAARGLFEERQRLEDAYIGTIHSFCARVLRENPVEAGVDPYFQILGEGEADILMDKLLDELFEARTQNDAWLEIMADFGEEEIREALKNLYETYRALGADEALFKINAKSSETAGSMRSLVGAVENLLNASVSEKSSEAEKEMRATLKELLGLLNETKESSWKSIASVRECSGKLSLRLKKFKDAIKEIKDLVDDYLSHLTEGLTAGIKREFLKAFFEFRDRFDAEKRQSACFDFEDLLFWTYKLFSGNSESQKAVLARYQESFSLIFVDEYQDTSFLQNEIIRFLKRPGNLFVVGDLQQSIYAFRHADPEIFHAISRSKSVKKIILRQNYRARPEILDFVNKLFEDKSENPYFEPLQAQKAFTLKKPVSVDILCVRKDDEQIKTLEQARIREAQAICARIREIVRSGVPVESDGAPRPARYGDFAILFKSTTASSIYERALQDASIPYYSSKGRGFFEKQEVMDVVNFLKIVDNPILDIPLAAVLRSPFVRLSEDALFWLARSVKSDDAAVPLIHALQKGQAIAEMAAEEKSRLAGFAAFLSALQSAKTSLRLSEIIERVIRHFDYEAKILSRPDGKQKLANVQKLVEMSRSLEEKGIFGIDDFVHFLKKLSESDALLSEAKIEAMDQDTVKLFTVHSAKGLEFPFVLIADMGQGKKKNTAGAFLYSKTEGFGLKMENPVTFDREEDATYRKISAAREENEKKEDLRLLYVALTRAKEHLILSGCDTEDSWMGRVCRLVPTEGMPPAETLSKEKPPSADDLLDIALSDKAVSVARAESLGFTASKERLSELEKRLAVIKKPYDHYEDLTVTDLLLFQNKDAKKDFFEEAAVEASDEEAAPRNQYGTIFHAVLEHFVVTRPKKIHQKMPIWKIAGSLSKIQKEELWMSVNRFWSGPLAAEIRAARECFPELPFIYKTKHGILKGQIDVVFKSKAGEWVILDYKTNQITPAQLEKVSSQYEWQLALYALIFRKLYGEAPAKGVLYFSALDKAQPFVYKTADFKHFETELERLFEAAALSLDAS